MSVQGRVLDLGCGDKPYESLLSTATTQWLGADQENSASGPTSADVIVDLRAPLPFDDESFDTVLCTQVLEHVPEPLQLLHEIRRVLRPGGRLVLTAPQTNPVHEAPNDFFRFTPHGLVALCGSAGLKAETVEPLGGAIAAVSQQITWHLAPISRPPLIGSIAYAGIAACLQWLGYHLDNFARRHGDGGSQTTIGHILVARR